MSSIRPARPQEAAELTELAVHSKTVWGYDDEVMVVFREELTITPEQIEPQRAHVLEHEGRIVGFYSLSTTDAGERELEHLFVEPDALRAGFGAALLRHACRLTHAEGHERLRIMSDPDALGFYERLGARRVGDVPSSIPGRSLPLLSLALPGPAAQ